MTSRIRARSSGTTTRRRNTWRKDPAGRRVRVLNAASDLFGRRAYDAVRVQEIATAAGVSEGSIYHYFGSKDGLLLALAEQYGRGFAQSMFRGLAHDDDPPDVGSAMRRAFAYVRHSHPLFGVFLLSDDLAHAGGARRANREEIVSPLAAFLESWSTRGLIRPVPPRIVATLLFGLVESALKECFVRGNGAEEECYLDEVVRAIQGILFPGSHQPGTGHSALIREA